MLTKSLAGMHVGEVDLNDGKIHSGQGIPNCDTRVRISRRIDDNAIRPVNVVPDKRDDCTFGIILKDLEINAPS